MISSHLSWASVCGCTGDIYGNIWVAMAVMGLFLGNKQRQQNCCFVALTTFHFASTRHKTVRFQITSLDVTQPYLCGIHYDLLIEYVSCNVSKCFLEPQQVPSSVWYVAQYSPQGQRVLFIEGKPVIDHSINRSWGWDIHVPPEELTRFSFTSLKRSLELWSKRERSHSGPPAVLPHITE